MSQWRVCRIRSTPPSKAWRVSNARSQLLLPVSRAKSTPRCKALPSRSPLAVLELPILSNRPLSKSKRSRDRWMSQFSKPRTPTASSTRLSTALRARLITLWITCKTRSVSRLKSSRTCRIKSTTLSMALAARSTRPWPTLTTKWRFAFQTLRRQSISKESKDRSMLKSCRWQMPRKRSALQLTQCKLQWTLPLKTLELLRDKSMLPSKWARMFRMISIKLSRMLRIKFNILCNRLSNLLKNPSQR